jgi:hypothetical protein
VPALSALSLLLTVSAFADGGAGGASGACLGGAGGSGFVGNPGTDGMCSGAGGGGGVPAAARAAMVIQAVRPIRPRTRNSPDEFAGAVTNGTRRRTLPPALVDLNDWNRRFAEAHPRNRVLRVLPPLPSLPDVRGRARDACCLRSVGGVSAGPAGLRRVDGAIDHFQAAHCACSLQSPPVQILGHPPEI